MTISPVSEHHLKLILHIGAEKTGTTTLQTGLRRNAGELARIGYYFPVRHLGNQNHSNLVVIAGGEDADGYLRRKAESSLDAPLETVTPVTLYRLRRELNQGNYHTAIFTSELMHSRLETLESEAQAKIFP